MDKKLISISLTFCVLICLLVVGYGVYKKYGLSIPADFNTNETAQSVVTEPQKTEEIITEPTTNADNEIMEKTIENLLSTMSVEEKVGQMFYARCPDSNPVETVSKYNLGGYILFGIYSKTKLNHLIVKYYHRLL